MPVMSRQRGGKHRRLPRTPLGGPGWGMAGGSRGSRAAACPCPTTFLYPSTSAGSPVALLTVTLLRMDAVMAWRRWWHWGQAVLTAAVSSAGSQPVAPTLPGEVLEPEVSPPAGNWPVPQSRAADWPGGAAGPCRGCSCLQVPRAGQGQCWFAQPGCARFGLFMLRAGRVEMVANPSCPIPSLLVPAQPQHRGKPAGGLSLQRGEDGAWARHLAGCCAGAWSMPGLVWHSETGHPPWLLAAQLGAAATSTLTVGWSSGCPESLSGDAADRPSAPGRAGGSQGLRVRGAAVCPAQCWLSGQPRGTWLVPGPGRCGVGGAAGPRCPSPAHGPLRLCPRFPSGSRHHQAATGSHHLRECLPRPGSLCGDELSRPRPRGRGELAACDTLDRPLTKRGAKSARLFWRRREVCETFGRDLPVGCRVTAAARLGLFQETRGAGGASRTLDSAAGCSTAVA